jgi:hypothetical protein
MTIDGGGGFEHHGRGAGGILALTRRQWADPSVRDGETRARIQLEPLP